MRRVEKLKVESSKTESCGMNGKWKVLKRKVANSDSLWKQNSARGHYPLSTNHALRATLADNSLPNSLAFKRTRLSNFPLLHGISHAC